MMLEKQWKSIKKDGKMKKLNEWIIKNDKEYCYNIIYGKVNVAKSNKKGSIKLLTRFYKLGREVNELIMYIEDFYIN